jgi:hypothetical protein
VASYVREVTELGIGCHREGADRPGGRLGRMRAPAPVTLSLIPARWPCFASAWRPFTAHTSPKECSKRKCTSHVNTTLLHMYNHNAPCLKLLLVCACTDPHQSTVPSSSDSTTSPSSTCLSASSASSGLSSVSRKLYTWATLFG